MSVLRTLPQQLSPAHTALIVVDVQNDFCHERGGLAARGGDLTRVRDVVVPQLAGLMRAAAAAGVLIVVARITQSPQTNSEAWEALEPAEGDRLVVEGSWGAQDYPGLPLELADLEIAKHRHSAFAATELDEQLRARGIRSLVLGGVATNVCVEGTAREAADRDYYVTVVEDATGAARADLHEMSLENVRRYLGRVTTCATVASAWADHTIAGSTPQPEPQEIVS